MENIEEWVDTRREDWHMHINRMMDVRLLIIARDNRYEGSRSMSRLKNMKRELMSRLLD